MSVPMMSWHPRMMPRKLFIFGPRYCEAMSPSLPLVRLWNDRRVQHFCRHAVAVLLGESGLRIPAAGVQLVPVDEFERADLVDRPTGRGDHAVRHERRTVVDEHHRAHRLVCDRLGCTIAKAR